LSFSAHVFSVLELANRHRFRAERLFALPPRGEMFQGFYYPHMHRDHTDQAVTKWAKRRDDRDRRSTIRRTALYSKWRKEARAALLAKSGDPRAAAEAAAEAAAASAGEAEGDPEGASAGQEGARRKKMTFQRKQREQKEKQKDQV
jgi:hypothetical protein